ncbi:MAG: O-antigen ligase family protein [bacterium]
MQTYNVDSHGINTGTKFPLYVPVVFLLFLFTPALLYFFQYKTLYVTGYFLFLASLVLINFPRKVFYLFIISISLAFSNRIGMISIHPADILFVITFMGVMLDFLLRTRNHIRSTKLDKQFLFLIFATWLSALFAYDWTQSVVPSIRILVIYFTFRIVFKYALEIGIKKLMTLFMILTSILSFIAFVQFYLAGGGIRSFGITGLTLQYFAMTAVPMAMVFIIWSRSIRTSLFYMLISIISGLGIFATQSRAPLLAILITFPVIMIVSFRKAKRENDYRTLKNIKYVLLPVIVLGLSLFILEETYFEGTISRLDELIQSLKNPVGTVMTRIVLWTSAIMAFFEHPFLGVGIGNMRIVHEVVPEVKLIPYWGWVKGMSAHNVLLHYLAETGIIGASALVYLFWKNLSIGFKAYKIKLNKQDNMISTALFIASFVCFITMFYMRSWTWGMDGHILAFIFGLNTAWYYQLNDRF